MDSKKRQYVDSLLECMGFYQSVRDVCIGEHWNINVPKDRAECEDYKIFACNLREIVTGIGQTIHENGLDLCYSRAVGDSMAHAFSKYVRKHLLDDVMDRHMNNLYPGYLQSLEAFAEVIPDDETPQNSPSSNHEIPSPSEN